MGFLNRMKSADINMGVAEYAGTPNAWLLDVRSEGEYMGGHIPQSRNLPLQKLGRIHKLVTNPHDPIYLYCLSGARSSRAESRLRDMGYRNVVNLGGISAYKGAMEY